MELAEKRTPRRTRSKNKEPLKIEHKTAFPEEHIYPPNEETHFHRAL